MGSTSPDHDGRTGILAKAGQIEGRRMEQEKQDRVVLTHLFYHAVNERQEAMAGRGERI